MESVYLTAILFSIIGGLGASLLRLPPLIGFLGAGFAVHAMGLEEIPFIDSLAELGVTTLLFTIGLKLNPKDIVAPRVVFSGLGHAFFNTVVFAALFSIASFLPLRELTGLSVTALIYIGIATSFSSTVFVMSHLEEQNRSASAIGRIAIGVLILQDIIAVGVLVASSGKTPELWALALPLLFFIRPLAARLPNRMFRTELLVLTGIGIAVAAYSAFELAGLSGSLGSLVAGILLSSHPISERLSKALISIRELLLVAFFIQIGLGGLPSAGGYIIAAIMVLFLVFKATIFIWILKRNGLSLRTSALASLTLSNYSEFGLIVMAAATQQDILPEEWTSIMAVAVAGSFIASSLMVPHEDKLVSFLQKFVPETPEDRLVPEEAKVIIDNADALIMGMGRVGVGVYGRLVNEYGMNVFGVDFDEDRIAELREQGYQVIPGDVTDPELWHHIELEKKPALYVLALSEHAETYAMIQNIRKQDTEAVVATTIKVQRFKGPLLNVGADMAVYLYDGAGEELADRAVEALRGRS